MTEPGAVALSPPLPLKKKKCSPLNIVENRVSQAVSIKALLYSQFT